MSETIEEPKVSRLAGVRWCSIAGSIQPWEEYQDHGCVFCGADSTGDHRRVYVGRPER